jgi:hypothetical protein
MIKYASVVCREERAERINVFIEILKKKKRRGGGGGGGKSATCNLE